ncbi:MGMT family protein [Candidatus Kaiserbacteria bacterium]|nr:MGMT family protein [Candidatus Kaiserbacteria bacterium]
MTDFQEQVKAVVRRIPKGEVLTYGEVAEKCGRPQAARAVANVMAANYDPTVPCHRVIRSDGGLGGYNRGGEAQKRTLLLAEGVLL